MLNIINIKRKLPYFIAFIFVIVFNSCNNTSTTYKPKKCNNQCSESGIFCDENNNSAVFNCTQDKNGCLIKEVFEECANNKVCILGQCQVKNCESECINEGYFCENNKRYECGNFNNDSCLEKKEAFCEEGYNCVMGECKQDCIPTQEICDGLDNNCDGDIDEGVKNIYYKDADGDSFGDITDSLESCTAPDGYVENSGDCDDNNKDINPNAIEICDEKDNDCDGNTDRGCACTIGQVQICGPNEEAGECKKGEQTCKTDGTWSECLGAIYPTDEMCDGLDNNCDGDIDEGVKTTYYKDSDNDNFGDINDSLEACSIPDGYVENSADCDDGDGDINPNTDEICDGQDNNCDGHTDEANAIGCTDYYLDSDNDDYGKSSDSMCLCDSNEQYRTTSNGDCNDDNDDINPDAEEICDGQDNNCDGSIDEGFDDTDSDGIADCVDNCVYTPNFGQLDTDNDNMGNVCDCYQGNPDIAITEICNGVDDNCNGKIDEGDVCATDDCTMEVYDNHNYIFCNSSNSKKLWEDARKYCNEKNYNLVTIETAAENNWILTKINHNYWIGLYDFKGNHKWESGEGTIWNTEHDDWSEECWEIQDGDSKWHDRACSNTTRRFICEEKYNFRTIKTLAKSCNGILTYAQNNNLAKPHSGVYYINVGTANNIKPQLVYCDMDTDGGGWTLVASWFYDYKWTFASNSSSRFFGMATKDTVSSNFGNMIINNFRIVASENIFDNGLSTTDGVSTITRKAKADWYYHYNNAIPWKKVWAPQAHNNNDENDCSNGYLSPNENTNNTSRQSLKKFDYSKNIKFKYTSNNHHWNNISDWSTIYDDGIIRPQTCDKIADYWGALTQEGIEFTVYNNSNNDHDPVKDGVLGIPKNGNDTKVTGHDIDTNYNARVGYDDDNANACYGINGYDVSIFNDDTEDMDDSTKLWWFVR